MLLSNDTQFHPSSFLLLGIPGLESHHTWIGFPFCAVYLIALLGNFTILLVIKTESSLHQPMFYFLAMLATIDLGLSTATIPKMLGIFWFSFRVILFGACLTQMFFIHNFTGMESAVLLAMAYDRYVAICKPLHYMNIMSRQVCHMLVGGSWLGGLIHSIIQIIITIPLPFCGPNVIDHYFCDLHPLLKLACSDTFMERFIVMANSGLFSIISLFILVSSYAVILISLRKRSAEGRRKALSTCASHITVVILFFGPATFLYLRPSSSFTEDKLVAVFYTVITPMLNPIIYTLRNAEVKNAMKRLVGRKVTWEEK